MGELARTLSVWRGTALMLNIVLGAGLLTLPGLAAQAAGAAAPLIWLACAAVAAPLLAVFALCGRRWPDSGGLATIVQKGFGDFGYVAASLLFLGAVLFGLPAIALTGGHYVAAAVGGPASLYAAGLILAAAMANAVSAELAGRVNAAIASLLLVALTGILAVGWFTATPVPPAPAAVIADLPALPVLGATFMMVFFAFTGWEVSASLGGDFKNPRRDMPLAMGLSFVIVAALYAGLAMVVMAADLADNHAAPFAAILGNAFGPVGVWAVSALAVLLIFANLSAAIWAVARMVYAAAGERLLPSGLSAVRGGVPHLAVLATVAALLAVTLATWAGAIDLGALLATAGQNFLLLYAGAAAVLIRVPRRRAERALGIGCVAVVGALIVLRGPEGMAYPAALILAAAFVANNRCARAWDDARRLGPESFRRSP